MKKRAREDGQERREGGQMSVAHHGSKKNDINGDSAVNVAELTRSRKQMALARKSR
jgi:hypothetical protein